MREREESKAHGRDCLRDLQRQCFEVRDLGTGALGSEQAFFDACNELIGALADLVLLACGGERELNLLALPLEFERGEAREDTIELFGGALGENHQEFIGVETNREIGTANDGAHARGELAQGLIAGFAPEAFVDLAELLEIQHDERERMTHALRARDFGGEALVSEAAVVEAGQRVEHRQMAQAIELRLLVGKLRVQLLDEKFLANRVDVEKDDQQDESEDGFGETDFEERADALMSGHGGERNDRGDEQNADEDRVTAERRVALLDQRKLVLKLVFARIERGRDYVAVRRAHFEEGLTPEGQLKGKKIQGQWNFGLRGNM